MKEIWKDIPGYEGLYQVSNLGNVRGLERKIKGIDGVTQFVKSKNLKPVKSKNGYVQVTLKNVKAKTFRIHRLVAVVFISNPNNLPCINHKDENKENNSVENLEWCTHKYNNTYNSVNKRGALKRRGNNNQWYGKYGKEHNRSKKVLQYDLDMNLLAKYDSCREASKKTGVNYSSIVHCTLRKAKTAGGYVWKELK